VVDWCGMGKFAREAWKDACGGGDERESKQTPMLKKREELFESFSVVDIGRSGPMPWSVYF
jgi:hypothetical protein